MTNLARDLRCALPILAAVIAGWLGLQLLWWASLVWATSPTGHLAPLSCCQAVSVLIGLLSIPIAVASVPLVFSRRRVVGLVLLFASVAVITTGRITMPAIHGFKTQRLR